MLFCTLAKLQRIGHGKQSASMAWRARINLAIGPDGIREGAGVVG